MQSEIEHLRSLVQALTEKQCLTPTFEASQREQDALQGSDIVRTGGSVSVSWTSEAAREISQWGQQKVSPSAIGPTSIFNLETGFDLPTRSNLSGLSLSAPVWPSFVYDTAYRQAKYRCFVSQINAYEHLLEDNCLLALDLSLSQRLDSALLVLAVITAATVVGGELEAGDSVSQLAELWILRASRIPGSSLNLLQALTIFAWRELTVAGNKTRACLFISLAAGLLQQLGMFNWTELHVAKTRHTPQHRTQVAAFWAFSHVDRICTALLGTPSTIPWQRICIPRYSSVFESVGLETMTMEGLYFDHLWSIWHRQGYYMYAVYSPQFSTLQEAKRQDLLFKCRQELMDMRSSVNPRLKLDSSKFTDHHPFIYFLHMAIETSPIVMLLPFLGKANDHQLPLLLHEMFRSAFIVTDILFQYRKTYQLVKCPTMIVYYVVRSSVFLILLATSTDPALERRAARRLKISLESLEEMQQTWQQQASHAIQFLQGLATRWGVIKALPMRWSYSPDFRPSLQKHPASLYNSLEVDESNFDESSLSFNFTSADSETMQSAIADEEIKTFLAENWSQGF
ncbi:hypothetical protein CBS11852_6846 [Aspergillus niger]|nr:hypothetical protein CBS11852_6846 [Aspergillus niger]